MGVSFLGSLPPGILNLTQVQLALVHGQRAAWRFAVACAIVEIGYSYVAVTLTQSLLALEQYHLAIHIFSTLVLLVAGVYYVYKKSSTEAKTTTARPFYLGVVLSIVNVVAIPFWLVYTALLTHHRLISINSSAGFALYVMGIGLGTLLAMGTFARLSGYLSYRFVRQGNQTNRFIGLLFVLTSVYQIIDLIR